jgi:hypothetical protein
MKIALLDDKIYGLKAIQNALWKGREIEYFSSYKDILWLHYDILFLDYYLDIDRVVSKDIIDLLDADIIISYSSVQACNELMLTKWAHFSIQKIDVENNNEIKDLLHILLKNYE